MRHAIVIAFALHAGGCRVNQASVAPAPPAHVRSTSTWAADGVQVVQHGLPMFLVDGRYWHWHGGEWHVWRDLGWQVSPPPAALMRMDESPLDGGWQLGDVTPVVGRDDR